MFRLQSRKGDGDPSFSFDSQIRRAVTVITATTEVISYDEFELYESASPICRSVCHAWPDSSATGDSGILRRIEKLQFVLPDRLPHDV